MECFCNLYYHGSNDSIIGGNSDTSLAGTTLDTMLGRAAATLTASSGGGGGNSNSTANYGSTSANGGAGGFFGRLSL